MQRLVALLVSLMLLLPAGTVSAQALFCQMRGQLTSKCCCGEQASAPSNDEGPSARQGSCCESRTLAASAERRGVSALDELPTVSPPVVLAVLPVTLAIELPAVSVERAPARARAPPPARSAPLFILNRAFLS